MKSKCGILVIISFALICGCQGNKINTDNYQTVQAAPNRNTQLAEKLNAEALELLQQGKLDMAENKFKAAIQADLTHGPSHNNLGNVYFQQQQYYLAAWEFQYATKLMPKRIEPRNNLGMVFEAVNQLEQAADAYNQALEINPEDVEVIGNLARIRIKNNQKDTETRELLEKIVMRDTRGEWVSWAREKLALMPAATTQPSINQ